MLRSLYPREVTPLPIKWKDGWVPELVWAFEEDKFLFLPGLEHRNIQLVAWLP